MARTTPVCSATSDALDRIDRLDTACERLQSLASLIGDLAGRRGAPEAMVSAMDLSTVASWQAEVAAQARRELADLWDHWKRHRL